LSTAVVADRSPRRRRRMTLLGAAGVLLAMVLVTVLVTSPWMSDGDKVVRAPAGSQPQPPRCGLNTRGEAQTLPCDPGDGNLQLTEKVVVAQGDLETNHWQLEVYQSEAGLCVDLRIGPGAAGGCGSPTDPVGVGVSRFGGVSWLHGPVRKDVAKIRIVLADGQVLEVSPVGTSAGFPVN